MCSVYCACTYQRSEDVLVHFEVPEVCIDDIICDFADVVCSEYINAEWRSLEETSEIGSPFTVAVYRKLMV